MIFGGQCVHLRPDLGHFSPTTGRAQMVPEVPQISFYFEDIHVGGVNGFYSMFDVITRSIRLFDPMLV